jgi:hypothetical protein
MEWNSFLMGSVPILIGVAMGAIQVQGGKPPTMKMLQKQWGENDGKIIHFMGLCLLPIMVGGILLVVSANGGLGRAWEHFMN